MIRYLILDYIFCNQANICLQGNSHKIVFSLNRWLFFLDSVNFSTVIEVVLDHKVMCKLVVQISKPFFIQPCVFLPHTTQFVNTIILGFLCFLLHCFFRFVFHFSPRYTLYRIVDKPVATQCVATSYMSNSYINKKNKLFLMH